MAITPDTNGRRNAGHEQVQPIVKDVQVSRMQGALEMSKKLALPSANILGLQIEIDSDVFSPAFYSETEFFTRQVIKHLSPGEDYLDMGCGAGATTVAAAVIAGANVTAADINPAAVSNTQKNVDKYKAEARLQGEVEVRQSDVYDGLDPEKKYDTIYWNTPFGYVEEGKPLTDYQRAVFDPGYNGTRRFIQGARSHLKPGGKVLIGFSSTLGNQEVLEVLAEDAGLRLERLAQERERDNPNEVFLEFYRGSFNS